MQTNIKLPNSGIIPWVFPILTVFHFVLLAYQIYQCTDTPFPSKYWLQAVWMLAYALLWLGTYRRLKWATYMYILISLADLALAYAKPEDPLLSSAFIPINLNCAAILFVFFKKLFPPTFSIDDADVKH